MVTMSLSVRRLSLYLAFLSLTICGIAEAGTIKSPRWSRSPVPSISTLRTRQNNDTVTPGGSSSNGSFTPVVGCSNVVDRRTVDDLQSNHPDVFNMLLLALQGVQSVAENDDLSWYQVSGIHGYPYVPWQEDPDFVPANPRRGYCTHGSAIFTTWHRPYLLLLEQLLCDQARSIAQQFEGYDAARWRAAAEEVRVPYWDWSSTSTRSRIPSAVKQETIAVTAPTGPATIANPLFSYKFLSPQPSESGLGTETIRSPSDDQLAASFESRRQATLNLFTNTAYNQFSDDVEGIHNTIHVQVGGNMVSVPRSAFDPIFFLHHANVDRLMAMYQATHPGVVLTPESRSPTFALGGPGPDDLSTLLYPFRHPDLNQWTSNDVANAESIFTYGYSYPEVPPGLSTEELQSFTTQKVNELFAPAPAAVQAQSKFASSTPSNDSTDTPTSRLEWTANVQVKTNGLVGSHRIRFYIGSDRTGDNLAGVAAIFASPSTPISTPNDQINASIPLTPTLVDKSVNLDPNDAVPVLTDELNWVVERSTDDGTGFNVIEPSDLTNFVVSVVSNEATYPEDKSQLPTKGEPTTYYEPTVGKAGGLQQDEEPKVGVKIASVNGTTSASRMLKTRRMKARLL